MLVVLFASKEYFDKKSVRSHRSFNALILSEGIFCSAGEIKSLWILVVKLDFINTVI